MWRGNVLPGAKRTKLVARAISSPIRSSMIRSTPGCGEGAHCAFEGRTMTRCEKSAFILMRGALTHMGGVANRRPPECFRPRLRHGIRSGVLICRIFLMRTLIRSFEAALKPRHDVSQCGTNAVLAGRVAAADMNEYPRFFRGTRGRVGPERRRHRRTIRSARPRRSQALSPPP